MERTQTDARPDLAAKDLAATTPYPLVVEKLVDLIGSRLVAYIGGVKDARTVAAWTRGDVPHLAGRRLQLAYAGALTLEERYDRDRIQAWFTWLNDFLDDASPSSYVRSLENDEEIDRKGTRLLQAARRELAE
ncbi:MAG: hypothetical protein ACYDA5_10735 [Vulcanimicrobiaceae bacterium]